MIYPLESYWKHMAPDLHRLNCYAKVLTTYNSGMNTCSNKHRTNKWELESYPHYFGLIQSKMTLYFTIFAKPQMDHGTPTQGLFFRFAPLPQMSWKVCQLHLYLW